MKFEYLKNVGKEQTKIMEKWIVVEDNNMLNEWQKTRETITENLIKEIKPTYQWWRRLRDENFDWNFSTSVLFLLINIF